MPLALRSAITDTRCCIERPRRSRRHTTSVLPFCKVFRQSSSPGRSVLAPLTLSEKMALQPAALSSFVCRAKFWSVGTDPRVSHVSSHDVPPDRALACLIYWTFCQVSGTLILRREYESKKRNKIVQRCRRKTCLKKRSFDEARVEKKFRCSVAVNFAFQAIGTSYRRWLRNEAASCVIRKRGQVNGMAPQVCDLGRIKSSA